MEAIAISALIRAAMWLTLFLVALWRRYPTFALMGFLGAAANVTAAIGTWSGSDEQTWRLISGITSLILIPVIILTAFQGMRVRDKLGHPLSRKDLEL